MADNSSNTTRRRGRSSEASARAEALERLKSLRQGGGGGNRTNNYQVRIETPIYDTIDEDEYESLVAKRREEARSFIVDDEGLGYGDEGEEEDWTKAGIPPSSDESDGEKEGRRKKKKGPVEVKEKVERKVSSSLSAAAAMMGKQRLSSMFTNSVFKKSRAVGADSIVDDVIAEFAPDEEDRERRRRGGLGSGSGSGSRSNGVGVCVKSESHSGNGGLANGDRLGGLSTNRGFESRSAGNSARISGEHVASVEENQGGKSFADEADMELIIKSEGNGLSIIEGGVVEEKGQSLDEVKEDQEMVVKKEEVRTLNARITDERDPALNATAGWKAMKSGESVGIGSVKQEAEEKFDFELEPDGSLPFHLIDVHEEIYGANMGTLYLFGKVKAGGTYHSCCVVVKNMQRCVYAIPNGSLFHSEEVMKLEKDAEDHRISTNDFRKKLQELASGLKTEIAKHLLDLNISTFSMAPVKRKYAFERLDIPSGENYLLKINYPFKDPSLPVDLKGETFSSLLGTHSSALELFLVKRKIKGPCWLSISNFTSCPQRVSWCKFEATVDCPKDIQIMDLPSSKIAMEIPPVVVTAINLKTILNEKQNLNEIVSASVICCHKVKIDTPMLASEWKKPGMLSHFSVVRKLDGGIFPMGFNKEAIDRNTKAGSTVLSIEMSERALLNRLITELHKFDSDVLVGHNISGFDLDVLLHRTQACMGRSNAWSKIGRLRRSVMPKLTRGNNIFGSGASPGIMSCISLLRGTTCLGQEQVQGSCLALLVGFYVILICVLVTY